MPVTENSYSGDPFHKLAIDDPGSYPNLTYTEDTMSCGFSAQASQDNMEDQETGEAKGSGLLSIAQTSNKKIIRYYHAFPVET